MSPEFESDPEHYPAVPARRRWLRDVVAVGASGMPLSASFSRGGLLQRAPAAFDASDGRAIINIHANDRSEVWVAWSTDAARLASLTSNLGRSKSALAERANGYCANVTLEGLPAATRVYYAAFSGRERVSEIQQFKTPPSRTMAADFSLAFSGDMEERYQPFRVFDVIAAKAPDAFLHLGDTIYADIPRRDFSPTLSHYRRKHAINRDDRALQRFAATTPLIAVWDDHEIENDSHGGHPAMGEAEQAFREYWPSRTDRETGLYRKLNFGRDLELFVLDTRRFRSVQSLPDSAEKTMLGAAQKLRFLQEYLASKAKYRLIASSVPLHGSSKDAWGNYETERDELLTAFREASRRDNTKTIVLSADYHFAREWPRNEKFGIYEFMAGPLAAFLTFEKDGAARERHTRGSHFVFGERANFGVLRYDAKSRSLSVTYFDDNGKQLHSRTI